ncbi:MAG: hypothetical protein IJY83_07525 [Oscillospiraceae bacterium]|nr:hypothetical protein [Oscillospiraceae bacterium]
MSAKNVDKYNRFRSITVGFRVSPEEFDELNRAVALSGLPKQEYCYRKCMNRDIVVQGNPRVYKQLKINLEMVLSELKRIENGAEINAELIETIQLINTTLYGLKGECE